MLDFRTIEELTREAEPVDFRMLRSYIARAPTVPYARNTTVPSLRIRHPEIWMRIESRPLGRVPQSRAT